MKYSKMLPENSSRQKKSALLLFDKLLFDEFQKSHTAIV